MKKSVVIMLLALCVAPAAMAQRVGVKTNLLYWATTTPNIGLELGLGKRTTLDIETGFNPWTLDKDKNRKIKHILVMPEFRYWLCERFQGHFFGVHSGYAFYNISNVRIPLHNKSTENSRYEGWATGAGISYGYMWILGKRLNLEATLGVGYVYTEYDEYDCETCGDFKGSRNRHFFGPTKAGISLTYMIR